MWPRVPLIIASAPGEMRSRIHQRTGAPPRVARERRDDVGLEVLHEPLGDDERAPLAREPRRNAARAAPSARSTRTRVSAQTGVSPASRRSFSSTSAGRSASTHVSDAGSGRR